MSLEIINIQDDQGRDCPIRDIRAFQKHLQLFHRTGVSVHDEDGHYFTVDDACRQKIDKLVEEADRSHGGTAAVLSNCLPVTFPCCSERNSRDFLLP